MSGEVSSTAPPRTPRPRRRTGARGLALGVGILATVLLATLLAPLYLPFDPLEANLPDQYLPPGTDGHLFGTDRSGFDIFSRVVYGARYDLLIALIAIAVALVVGVPLGLLAGYRGRATDTVISRLLDVFQAFPLLVLAIAVLGAFGRGIWITGVVIGVVSAPTFVRLVREQTRTIRDRMFVEAARCSGFTEVQIMRRYVLPANLGVIYTQAATSAAWAILLAAALGFVGVGVPAPLPEWGYMISTGTEGLTRGIWWTSVFPGLAIVLLALAFTLIGESLSRWADPRRRRSR
ncbi:diguanylate cyclase [Phytohabitans suffuscus]|uniref:Diguanylate cyclase n=1 Tax=Phytohabitans suffuscus TaxID=624315 RepID=A0A6F8YDY6_9ACTN|nr:diguanylate cyclase [Phytohabitans suffuscus]